MIIASNINLTICDTSFNSSDEWKLVFKILRTFDIQAIFTQLQNDFWLFLYSCTFPSKQKSHIYIYVYNYTLYTLENEAKVMEVWAEVDEHFTIFFQGGLIFSDSRDPTNSPGTQKLTAKNFT